MPEVGLLSVGELVRFTTKANGDVVGSYFNGLFYSGTSNDCWSPQYVISWCRVLVLSESGTREVVINALRRQTGPESLAADADAILSALREAAIR